jgi:hypothetical protein
MAVYTMCLINIVMVSFAHHVLPIILWRTKKQVLRIATRRLVALVQNIKAIRNRASRNFIHQSMH